MMGGGRKRSRRLAFLVPLLAIASGDGLSSQDDNQPSMYHNTSCVAGFSWEQNDELHQIQTADTVCAGSTTAACAAASTCPPLVFDTQTPPLNGKAHSIFSSASIFPKIDADLDADPKCSSEVASLRDDIELLKMQVESLTRRQIENQAAQCDASSSSAADPLADLSSSRMLGPGGVKILPPSTLADAAAAGAVLGFFSGGPLLAAVGAASTTWAATQDNPVGDVARAFGDLVAVTNHQLRRADEKYHILDHVGVAVRNLRSKASKLLRSIKTFEREKKVIDKVTTSAAETWMKAVAFEREHRVAEEISQRMAKLVRTLARVISGNSTTPGSDDNGDWFGDARLE